jgi:hypothetical protein
MNIGKSIHFLRRDKQRNWHKGQPLSQDSNQHSNEKIVEYQDRWTMFPTRGLIWLNGWRNHTEYNHTHSHQ